MDILMIGNGFDIAHRLPTTYVDFLNFIKITRDVLTNKQKSIVNWYGFEEKRNFNFQKFSDLIYEKYINRVTKDKDKLMEVIEENFWLNYFLEKQNLKTENWIDFEKEISNVIQVLEKSIYDADNYSIDYLLGECLKKCCKVQLDFAKCYISNVEADIQYCLKKDSEFSILSEKLKEDLDTLIEILEIYLLEYVQPLINKYYVSPDIQSLSNSKKLISFNYTHTYSIVYGKSNETPIHYIHGSIRTNKEDRSNNMVLGIDEYLSDDENNTKLDFIEFKKYFQRIFKGTGAEYKEWLKKLENPCAYHDATKRPNLYIFGHSLDISDKDIIKELILNQYLHTTIFYHNKKSRAEKIINLVKVIGQDKLIELTGNGRIKFVEQKDMELVPEQTQ